MTGPNQPHTFPIPIGTRLCLREGPSSHRGTLRYTGPLASVSAPADARIYLGIDWDDAERGKHDGSHAGTRYFDARQAMSGSLLKLPSPSTVPDASNEIKLSKVRVLSFGMPFLDAVREKYAAGTVETGVADPGEWGGKVVELVGWDKLEARLAKIDKLEEVSVAGLDVRAGNVEGIADALPSIRELDVSRGLWTGLVEIGRVVAKLPSLEHLRAGGNLLSELDPLASGPRGEMVSPSPFANVRTLALTHLLVPPSWTGIVGILHLFPNLDSLALSHNDLSGSVVPELEQSNPSTSPASEMALESCQLSSIPTSLSSFFPKVAKLNLSHNPISQIPAGNAFRALRQLNLTGCSLSTWTDIHTLNDYNLADIRLRGNPILSSLPTADVLPVLSARLANPSRINGTDISARDRSDAELWYVSRAWLDRSETPDGFDHRHPRFWDIVRDNSLPYSPDQISKPLKPAGSIARTMLDLTIRVHRAGKTVKVVKKVPPGMMVSALARMVKAERCEVDGVEMESGRELAWYFAHEGGGEVDAWC